MGGFPTVAPKLKLYFVSFAGIEKGFAKPGQPIGNEGTLEGGLQT